MPTRNKTIAMILQSIHEKMAYLERIGCSDLKELLVPITARFGRDEYRTLSLSTRYIADPRDAIAELVKVFIQQDLDLLKTDIDMYPPSCAEECRKIEEWMLMH